MGMTLHVTTGDRAVSWPAVAQLLQARQLPVQMRLIDGQLAFPDESPPDGWRELRVACEGRMVTIQRSDAGINLICWGNADATALAFRDALAAAFADEGS